MTHNNIKPNIINADKFKLRVKRINIKPSPTNIYVIKFKN